MREEQDKKEFWITNSRFKYMGLILLIIFLVIMALIFFKGHELSTHPCTLCAKQQGNSVYCMLPGNVLLTQTFYENGSIFNDAPGYGN